MKDVKQKCWCVESVEYTVPTPPNAGLIFKSLFGCNGACTMNCTRCQPARCGEVRTRQVLVEKEVTRRVPVYKCVSVPSCGCSDDEPTEK